MRLIALVVFTYVFIPAFAGALKLDVLKYASPVVLLIGFAYFYLGRRGKIKIPRIHVSTQMIILVLHASVILYSFFRSNTEGTSMVGFLNVAFNMVMLISVVMGGIQYVFSGVQSTEEFKQTFKRVIHSLYIPLSLCVIIAVAAYFMGYRMVVDDGESAVLAPGLFASLLGLNLDRTGFIVGGHPNGFGIFVAIILLTSIVIFNEGKLQGLMKWFNRIAIGACFFALLIVDSRSSIGLTMLVLGFYFLLKYIPLGKLVYIIYWSIPVLAIFVLVLLQLIAQTPLGSSLSRSDNDLASGNSRGLIWNKCIEELSEFEKEQILGYGQQGHIPSGVAQRYYKYLLRITYTHSFYFQTIFDAGYVGLFLTLLMMFFALRNGLTMRKHDLPYASIFVLFPLIFCLLGIFEAPYGEHNSMDTALYNCMVYFSIFLYNAFLRYKQTLLKSSREGIAT